MKNLLTVILSLSLILGLMSCSSNTPRQNQVVGATAGAGAGAALAANSGPSPGPITVLGVSTIIGGIIGSTYSDPMESSDRAKALQSIAEGKPASWQNPATKTTFKIFPAPQYVTFEGNTCCRQFAATETNADGYTRKIFRTACKSSRGNWGLVH